MTKVNLIKKNRLSRPYSKDIFLIEIANTIFTTTVFLNKRELPKANSVYSLFGNKTEDLYN